MAKTTVKLLTHTKDPISTLYNVWHLSRANQPFWEIEKQRTDEGCEVFFEKIINEDIPLTEMIDFVFLLENVSVSLREQLVRHRIGVKVDARIGFDIVPNLDDSSFWIQSMRVLDLSNFFDDGKFLLPENIEESTIATIAYKDALRGCQEAYRKLIRDGIPKEDARNILPLGTTHRLVWKVNLSALKHIVGKRGCWILQLGLWEPVLHGIVDCLATAVHPLFRKLISPPCLKGECYKLCPFCESNTDRIIGDKDTLPPCPLFLTYEKEAALKVKGVWYSPYGSKIWISNDEEKNLQFALMLENYQKLWGRDPWTGKSI